MNLYLLMEGRRGEAKVYPAWLASLDRPYTRLMKLSDVDPRGSRSFYPFSAEGYPSIVGHHLKNAVADVVNTPRFDWLVVCLDVDESSVVARIPEVEAVATSHGLDSSSVRLFVCPQDRCLESWVLGNSKIIGAAPPPYLNELLSFYDVRASCPEKMGHPRSWANHAQFHFHYAREAFKAKRLTYSKSNPGEVATASYLEALKARMARDANCMPSLRRFLEFVEAV